MGSRGESWKQRRLRSIDNFERLSIVSFPRFISILICEKTISEIPICWIVLLDAVSQNRLENVYFQSRFNETRRFDTTIFNELVDECLRTSLFQRIELHDRAALT